MKNLFAFLILFACSFAVYGQEICDNGTDDDGDGLIDLNDPDCNCSGFGVEVSSLIPNPSFEDRTCCPVGFSELTCANDWAQASSATSDYFHACGTFNSYPGGIAPELPLPGDPGGEGFAGFILWKDWNPGEPYYGEYIGCNTLLTPLEAGTSYTLNVWTAWSTGDVDVPFSLFGTSDLGDMPWAGFECPIGIGSWELLATQDITYETDGSWQEVSLVFTPTVDINAIAIGGPCDLVGFADLSYYYVDGLTLNTSSSFSNITESGSFCIGDVALTAEVDTTGGSWQWYLDGIALPGETDATINGFLYGEGDYSAVYFLDGDCARSNYTLIDDEEGIVLDLIYNEPTCFGYSDGSVTVNVGGGDTDLTFEITNSDDELLNIANSNTANELPTGWYYINVIFGEDCGGMDSIFLDQPGQLDIEITTENVACFGDASGWAQIDDVINYTGNYDGISYFWNPNPSENEGLGADSSWALTAGNYTVTINDENGCSEVFDFVITQPDELVVTVDFNPALCRTFGYQSGNGVVFGDAEGGVPTYTFLWTNLDTDEEYLNTTWGGLNPGNYEFTVTDENGCVTVETVYLDSINPEAIFSVNSAQLNADCQGTAAVEVEFINESINFSNEGDPTADTTFFWNLNSPTNAYEITHSYEYSPDTIYSAEGQTYQIEVCLIAFNKNDCQDEACKTLTIYEPIKFTHVNIFSPNGDGTNDFFTFEYTSASISQFNCVIVNRWGVVVHEMTAITDVWDGTDRNGDVVKDGTYFYTYEAITDDGTELKGQGNITKVAGE